MHMLLCIAVVRPANCSRKSVISGDLLVGFISFYWDVPSSPPPNGLGMLRIHPIQIDC